MTNEVDVGKKNHQGNIFAYKSIKKDHGRAYRKLAESFDRLVEISDDLRSPLLKELKMAAVLAIKWRFDYLAKTRESPFLLQADLDYWNTTFEMLSDLAHEHWFSIKRMDAVLDPWVRTMDSFNFMWPRNTQGDDYNISREMVVLRMNQIYEMLEGGRAWILGKTVVDSGCGPGRYSDVISEAQPAKIFAFDSGADIIAKNRERFGERIVFERASCDHLPLAEESVDFVISAGVLHHLRNPIDELISEHARILKKGGYMFVYIAGTGGLELKLWHFMRAFLKDVSIGELFERYHSKICSMRLQGLLDHGYGEYQETPRQVFESWLQKNFSTFDRVPGVAGLDVTEEIYWDDVFFNYRFGSGNLRYLCRK